ncbi:hypothetical protein [Streptomyces sp. A5-4]|uniref:hypothetical protein n=1 Tax=Streptomyces sp. A5-4 TaxID=3384771 RepID=UPI003DA925DF
MPAAPTPDAEWIFPAERTRQGGMARVHYAEGHDRLTKPVIISDGFNSGPSNMDEFWDGLENKGYAFATELSRRGYGLILLGYLERSASLLDNAGVAQECVQRAIGERVGDAPLTVGGFSMGGIITRYTLQLRQPAPGRVDPRLAPGAPIAPQASDLDEFRCSTTNTTHSQMTAELGGWILDRLPE